MCAVYTSVCTLGTHLHNLASWRPEFSAPIGQEGVLFGQAKSFHFGILEVETPQEGIPITRALATATVVLLADPTPALWATALQPVISVAPNSSHYTHKTESFLDANHTLEAV